MKKSLNLLFKIFLFPFVVFVINYIATTYYWELYHQLRADTALHFFGGISIAYSTLYVLGLSETRSRVMLGNKKTTLFFVVCVVALAAVLWEEYEYIHDIFYRSHFQPNNADTMKDLFMGLLGGFLYTLARIQKKTP